MNFDFLNDKRIQLLFSLFGEAEKDLYVVGGVVRNELCGIINDMSDIDLATNALPKETEMILKRAGIEYSCVGRMFGTITATLNDSRYNYNEARFLWTFKISQCRIHR